MYDFKQIEDKVQKFWQDHRIFEKSTEQRAGKKRFVFYEGPPTANGHPGIHHFLARAFKDLFNRYKSMHGYFVLRKAGWDTHGLPVELGIEKELGFKNKKDIEEYLPAGRQASIAAFNRKARESVWNYRKEWEDFTRRMAFWVDMKNPYVTYETPYMETLWYIMHSIYKKDLLYQAHRVAPYCTRCGTTLSAHELGQPGAYQTVTDNAVYLKFKITDQVLGLGSDAYILAWTTTPWTLPGNVALAVGQDIQYVAASNGTEKLILAKELVEKVLTGDYKIEKEFKGSDLIGVSYKPLFDIPALRSETAYKVYDAAFVATNEGTGVVHTAVMYGEDDYALGTKIGLPKIHTVTLEGKFTGVGHDLDGMYVKSAETEKKILGILETNGNILKIEKYEHEYPFCWRCNTPLLYYAKNSWFIRMSGIKDKLIANNEKINWVPEHIKEGRFGQWIKEGKDWAFSRERYWGTPLPIWQCSQCHNTEVIDSIKNLSRRMIKRNNTYYIMRHGASTRHESTQMIISSRLNADEYSLTEEGIADVTQTMEQLKLSEEKIDAIYASPFKRTSETAQIAGKIFHKEIQIDERLGEISHGNDCEGKPHTFCALGDTRVHFDDNLHDSGESWNDVRRRLMEFMNEIESKYKNKKILIVSHGDPLWLLNNIGHGYGAEEILSNKEKLGDWYPKLAETHRLEWRPIPRNDLGELDLHRPFIDDVTFKCSACKAEMKRIPDLCDVWFDSGCMPFAQWHWPFENKSIFKQQYPADFICEAIDQTRGWFYTLLAVSTLIDKGTSFKNVLSLAHVLDEKGKKMSKSKGNIVAPNEVMDKVGVDATRWYFYTINQPGDYKPFVWKDVEERLKGFMFTLQNCLNFYELYETTGNELPPLEIKAILDKWLMSRLNGTIKTVSETMDKYDPTTAARAIEKFVVEDLSQWWLRRSRKRTEARIVLHHTLFELSKILAPFIPYTAEDMHMRLHKNSVPALESIHLYDWPKVSKSAINEKLEQEMTEAKNIISAGLALRKDKGIKVRQPLSLATITRGKTFNPEIEDLIRQELNVKGVAYKKEGELELDTAITAELAAEGFAREAMRQIQDMRKEAKYRMDEPVYLQWSSTQNDVTEALNKWADMIKRDTVLNDFVNTGKDDKAFDIQKEVDLAPGKPLWLGIKK